MKIYHSFILKILMLCKNAIRAKIFRFIIDLRGELDATMYHHGPYYIALLFTGLTSVNTL